MPLHVRTYKCKKCCVEIDRDINAAINIKRWGIERMNRDGTAQIYAYGDTSNGGLNINNIIDGSSYVSLKQENISSVGREAASL